MAETRTARATDRNAVLPLRVLVNDTPIFVNPDSSAPVTPYTGHVSRLIPYPMVKRGGGVLFL